MGIMKGILSIFLLLTVGALNGQTELIISDKTYTNSQDTWEGVNIPREVPTNLIFKNNTISSSNRFGYMLQAGDESSGSKNNNLDGAKITGNKFTWSGTDTEVIPHGIFTGHNKDVLIKYNYLNDVPMGIVRKSGNNMSNTGGGVAYNIVKGGAVAMVVKGMSNVNIYNNTFYNDRTSSETWRPLLYVYSNTDGDNNSFSHGTKIFNNIFYTKHATYAITIDEAESLTGLQCDYNLYWSEAGPPLFFVEGSVKTFLEWQAMGFDAHSVVMNPKFRDLNNFVPETRLDYGTDLGQQWSLGLASSARWGNGDPATAVQNGKWQVGAVVKTENDSQDSAPGIIIYPNPAKNFINISGLKTEISQRILKIYDISGKLQLKKNLSNEFLQNVPIDLKPGVYILQLEVGSTIEHIQKLIVIE